MSLNLSSPSSLRGDEVPNEELQAFIDHYDDLGSTKSEPVSILSKVKDELFGYENIPQKEERSGVILKTVLIVAGVIFAAQYLSDKNESHSNTTGNTFNGTTNGSVISITSSGTIYTISSIAIAFMIMGVFTKFKFLKDEVFGYENIPQKEERSGVILKTVLIVAGVIFAAQYLSDKNESHSNTTGNTFNGTTNGSVISITSSGAIYTINSTASAFMIMGVFTTSQTSAIFIESTISNISTTFDPSTTSNTSTISNISLIFNPGTLSNISIIFNPGKIFITKYAGNNLMSTPDSVSSTSIVDTSSSSTTALL